MKTLTSFIGILLAIGSMSVAYSCMPPDDCYMDGQWYKHGTRVGNYICQCGRWVRAGN